MLSGSKKIGVVYLNRKAEGDAPVRRFIESYKTHDAGVTHEFITLYKGFDPGELKTSKLLFEGIEHRHVEVDDDMTDIDAYLIAAQSISNISTFCFLNTFSEIARNNWLRHLSDAMSSKDVGIAGATASYESLLSSFRLNYKVVWMILNGFLKYDAELDRQYRTVIQKNLRNFPGFDWSASQAEVTPAEPVMTNSKDYSHIDTRDSAFEESWNVLVAEGAAYSFLRKIPIFPNPSIRTNAFIVDKEHLIPFFSGPGQRTKYDALSFESGSEGLTHSILRKGLRAVVVNSDGKRFDVSDWPRSQTFRLGNQEKLLVHDNQTRHFEQMPPPERDVLAYMSWGSCLNYPPDRVFTFGIPFSMDKPADKPDANWERGAARVNLLYAHLLNRITDPEGARHFAGRCRTVRGLLRAWWAIGRSAESRKKPFLAFRMAKTLVVLTWTLLCPLPAKAYRFTAGRLKLDLGPSAYFVHLLGSEFNYRISNLFSKTEKIPIERTRSTFEGKTIAVVYLARGASQEELASIERFFFSYNVYEAGLLHNLYVIYKGFGSEREKDQIRRSISIPHTALDFEDNHLDVGAFVEVGRLLNEDYVLFLNTHSELRADHWLSKLAIPLRDDKTGMVGCTGSFESLNPLDARFPPSPNPHLRSNAIMIDRRIFSDITKTDEINSKLDAWLFESGPNSLTNRVEALGKACVIVDQGGATYEMPSWQCSGVFRNLFRDNALIIDNQVRSFKNLPLSQKLILASSAWKFDPQSSDELFTRRKVATDCVVVIPTHKPDMTDLEEHSFRNTLKVLSDWDIHVLLPMGVDMSLYKSISKEAGKDITVMNLPAGFMGSTEKYNFMGLSHEFYKMFERYKYMLVCHLDAWVFRDELKYWINLGYDYIGAPLFLPEPPRYASLDSLMAPGGGNGGLCLRQISKMLELTREVRFQPNYALFIKAVWFLLRNRQFQLLKAFFRICRGILKDHGAFQKKHNVYEDVMISVLYALLDRTLRVAPPAVAYRFALEVNMGEIANTKLKFKLPFGVHGYDKYITPAEFRTLRVRQDIPYSNRFNAINKDNGAIGAPVMTVITAIKNIYRNSRVETLRQCIESVRSQSYAHIEHIVIDGASDDGTLEFLSEYVEKGWVKLHSAPDAGVWDAMNNGLKLASGNFVCFLNSDDYFCDSKAVQIAVDLIRERRADWFFSGATVLRSDGTTFVFPTSLYGVFSCFGIVHQTMFVRSDILKAANPFESPYVTKENYLMMLLILNGIKHAYYPGSLVHYREGGFSSSAYGGENTERTREDFAQYFYHLAGKRWRLTLEDCREMSGWRVFGSKGVKRSFRIGLKLRLWGLKIDYMKRLFFYIKQHRNPIGIVARKLKRALKFT